MNMRSICRSKILSCGINEKADPQYEQDGKTISVRFTSLRRYAIKILSFYIFGAGGSVYPFVNLQLSFLLLSCPFQFFFLALHVLCEIKRISTLYKIQLQLYQHGSLSCTTQLKWSQLQCTTSHQTLPESKIKGNYTFPKKKVLLKCDK